MQNVTTNSYMLAIDLADYLVRKGLPFHQTHSTAGRLDSTAGKLVQYAIGKNKNLRELSLDEYSKFLFLFAEDVYDITVETSVVAAQNATGGTAPEQVVAALTRARKLVGKSNEK